MTSRTGRVEGANDKELVSELKTYREELEKFVSQGPGPGKVPLQAGAPGRDPRSGTFVASDNDDSNGVG